MATVTAHSHKKDVVNVVGEDRGEFVILHIVLGMSKKTDNVDLHNFPLNNGVLIKRHYLQKN